MAGPLKVPTTTTVTTTISKVATGASAKKITEQSGILVIGVNEDGTPFSRAFPNINNANQWIAGGGIGSGEITRIESITFTQ